MTSELGQLPGKCYQEGPSPRTVTPGKGTKTKGQPSDSSLAAIRWEFKLRVKDWSSPGEWGIFQLPHPAYPTLRRLCKLNETAHKLYWHEEQHCTGCPLLCSPGLFCLQLCLLPSSPHITQASTWDVNRQKFGYWFWGHDFFFLWVLMGIMRTN